VIGGKTYGEIKTGYLVSNISYQRNSYIEDKLMEISVILKNKGHDVVTVSATDTMQETLKVFAEKFIGCAPVQDEKGKILGLISERDICRAIAKSGDKAVNEPVETGMRTEVVSCGADDHQARVMALMTSHRTRHVLVLDAAGDLAGIISIGDIVKHRLDTALRDEKSMLDYISGTGYSYQSDL